MRHPILLACCLGVWLLACKGDRDGAPRVSSIDVVAEENPHSALAMRLRVHAPGATAARAEWWEDGTLRRSARAPFTGAEAVIDVLGLRPEARYEAVVELEAPEGPLRSEPVTFTTGPLPAAVAELALEVAGTPPGEYLLVNLLQGRDPGVLVAFDGQGTLRWYRLFEGSHPVIEAKQLPGGNVLAFVGSSPGWTLEHGAYVEVSPSGELLRTFRATPPFYTDGHEALLTDAGTPEERIHLLGYESRTVELAPFGFSGTGPVVGHVIQRLLPSGEAEFTWNAFDHVALDELVNPIQPGQIEGFDYDHPNSLELDPRGDYLVSFRNLDALFLVDRTTGAVHWRLGGNRSDFTFVDDPLGGFSGQHDARLLPGDRLLLFDNGTLHDPPTSRAVEYELDVAARTARMVWEYRLDQFNAFTASAVRDADETTWVGASMFGRVYRVARDGTVLWEAALTRAGEPAQFYRAVPIRSLHGEP